MWAGDNLDIMRGVNSESVDLVYLDPLFNSNRTSSAPIGSQAAGAAFKVTWTLSDREVGADYRPSSHLILVREDLAVILLTPGETQKIVSVGNRLRLTHLLS